MSQVTIQNVVSCGQVIIKEPLKLNLVAAKVGGSRYNPKRFPAVTVRKTKPKGTALIFKSGKMIFVGCES